MDTKKMKEITNEVRQDTRLGTGEKLLICLDRSCDSILKDAWLLTTDGEIQDTFWETSMCVDQADEAVIRLVEDGADVVVFHESRPSSRDGYPNGIRVHYEDLDFPCVVFYNSGSERLTVDGEWVEPGEYLSVQEVNINDKRLQRM